MDAVKRINGDGNKNRGSSPTKDDGGWTREVAVVMEHVDGWT